MAVRASASRRVLVMAAVMLPVMSMASACTPADPVDGKAREASVLELIVAAVVDEEFGERDELDPLPVLYVVGRDGKVPFDVQAAVAAAMIDRVDLRFADTRAEALDETLDALPVRNAGRLLTVGPIPVAGTSIEVGFEVYADLVDIVDGTAALRYRSGAWGLEGIEFATTS
jgi:hypothetical protein